MIKDLSVIQKTYDLIVWYIPIIERSPRTHRFTVGDRIVNNLYELLEGLIEARYTQNKREKLQAMSIKLDVLRHQAQLLLDFALIDHKQYQYVNKLMNEVGIELGGWIKQQESKSL